MQMLKTEGARSTQTQFSLGGSVVPDVSGSDVRPDCPRGSMEAVSKLTIDLLVCKEAHIHSLPAASSPPSYHGCAPHTPLPGCEERGPWPGWGRSRAPCVVRQELKDRCGLLFFVPGSVDCAGILKLRNSDIELRKGETDVGRKNTRVRLVFRVHIPQPNGRTLSLQVASNPIECCEYQSQPRVPCSVLWHLSCFVVREDSWTGLTWASLLSLACRDDS